MRSEINVLALIKGADQFVYLYDDDCQEELIDAIRDHAADPALALSWFDAAVLTRRAREHTPVWREAPAVHPRR
jgi:hypothetical protein